jgi:hypothetical protein
MITVTPCSLSDSATVAQLWNHMATIAESCWYQAQPVTAETIAGFQASGLVFVLATSDQEPVGFGFWRPLGDRLRLNALAGETAEVYYRLMIAYAEWGLERELAEGWAEISPRETRERTWMDALGAIATQPIGREPLAEGENPALRTVELLRVTAALAALRQAALDEISG